MIRPTTPDDTAAILALAISSGLFPPDATDEVAAVLAGSLAGENGPDHVWLTDDDGGPVGVAYYAPERLTEGTWNLYMLAVSPDRQRQGRGAALVRTSGRGSFERTRAFYRALGYDEEARIREFYKAGDDKVVFRKALA
jgi:ribosomal protein S18 acetylase RimI-like enzyme